MIKPLLNSTTVCQVLGISPATLSRMVRANRIPFVLIGTGKKKINVRFREEELEAWLTRRSRGAVARSASSNDVAPRK
jgi:excisionase family DNA binding protein